ncbi:hypothetical protein J2S43_000324 [Catenuloplanes nepalensis]|uniref:Uncharacterized protein n=1 Tax=Catenuloplanes nepalensis TaxID=587533 RepID=A0ABT9MK67_9ACTN|nr:hypothetical protein [Catenuloplanes nepalensis]MDP9791812.1 hypothetical protein [Catenuloplanes nepalensis]
MFPNSDLILALHRSREADLMRAARADSLAARAHRRAARWHPRRSGPAPMQG